MLIMVRRNELACRDEWAHDLWVDRGASNGGPVAAQANGGAARGPVRPLPPATPEVIAAVVQAGGTGAAEAAPSPSSDRFAEDVVLGETRVIGEPERDRNSEPLEMTAAREANTREAIFKAREAHRERMKAAAARRPAESNGRDADEPGTEDAFSGARNGKPELAAGSAAVTTTTSITPPREVDAGPSASQTEEASIEWLRPVVTAPPVDRFDSVPEVKPGFDVPVRSRSTAATDESEFHEPGSMRMPEPELESKVEAELGARRGADVAHARTPEQRWPRSVPVVRAGDLRSERAWPSARGAPQVEPSPGRIGDGMAPDLTPADEGAAREFLDQGRGGYRYRFDPAPVPARETVNRFGYDGSIYDDEPPLVAGAEVGIDDENSVRGLEDEASLDEAPPEDVVVVEPTEALAQPVDDIVLPNRTLVDEPEVDLTVRVAPDVPRICQMCRDFRPAEGSGRGWCGNEWAFTHRRMVDGQDAMPCETTLGSWWLPADEMWSTRADVSSHGQPTPLLDAIMGYQREELMRRRGS